MRKVVFMGILNIILQIETLKESHERSRTMQEEEQRLFTTHAYYMVHCAFDDKH